MKKSIFIASFILLLVVGWIGSGQFSNKVIAQDDNTQEVPEGETSYSKNAGNNKHLYIGHPEFEGFKKIL